MRGVGTEEKQYKVHVVKRFKVDKSWARFCLSA